LTVRLSPPPPAVIMLKSCKKELFIIFFTIKRYVPSISMPLFEE
jgi:hypothetical protein